MYKLRKVEDKCVNAYFRHSAGNMSKFRVDCEKLCHIWQMLKVGTTPKLCFLPYESWHVSNHDLGPNSILIVLSVSKCLQIQVIVEESKNLLLPTQDIIDQIVRWV